MPPLPPNSLGTSLGGGSGQGPSSKLLIRIQQIARYRVTGRFSDTRIAEMVGLSAAQLRTVLQTSQYIEIEESLLEGRLSKIDEELEDQDDRLQEKAELMVPAALNALLEAVLQRRDLRASLVAAKEILDRDPKARFLANKGTTGSERDKADKPTLPADIVASLAVEGNKVVAEIKLPAKQGGQAQGWRHRCRHRRRSLCSTARRL